MTIKKETVDYLNKKYHQTLLFDFYGELIKENNRQIYEDYIFNDEDISGADTIGNPNTEKFTVA